MSKSFKKIVILSWKVIDSPTPIHTSVPFKAQWNETKEKQSLKARREKEIPPSGAIKG